MASSHCADSLLLVLFPGGGQPRSQLARTKDMIRVYLILYSIICLPVMCSYHICCQSPFWFIGHRRCICIL
ncbi:hypothetical protein Agabi119p4_3923 [Agaricus bisporus var. burnettii]|uniref:Uncharacterized protein n=1 Tax=Agaricus bisporus var. burnettii TaxID=192524 RepID=A0A8H7F5Q4_AGABI|nr:hypothetical protein Agabi119p4_3923 [Agaricus bisporus var. burnettii]